MKFSIVLKSAVAAFLLTGITVGMAVGQISIRSPLSNDREALPGSSYEGELVIKNETDKVQQAKIYQTDYLFYSDGSNIYGDPGTDERSNASWTRISASMLTLGPNESLPLSYEVDVPFTVHGNPVHGSYWSMIMIETVPELSPESTINQDAEALQYGVVQIMRYGIQIATHITGTGESILDISDTNLNKLDNGVTALELSVENSGSRMVRPELWVELYDESGAAFGRYEGIQNRIYPGTSIRQIIQLGVLEPGNYRALVIMDAGTEEVYGAEYRLAVK